MKVVLVTMPWAILDAPSLSLSTLAATARRSSAVSAVEVVYGNLRWADYVHAHARGGFDPDSFARIANGYNVATGEWVFSGALYGVAVPQETRFFSLAESEGVDLSHAVPLYELAAPFIDALAREIVAGDPDVVGFTTTFLQNVPSLALAKAIKGLRPETAIVFGGANCDGLQGETLHANFPFLDYVVRGEGERAFPQLLDGLGRDRAHPGAGETPAEDGIEPWAAISGLCWRPADGGSRVNAQKAPLIRMDEVPSPVFESYFEQLAASRIQSHISPRLWVEASRGCWWGAKHHCTFCGLNDATMVHRSKSPDRLWSELQDHIGTSRVLDIMFADNILDMAYLKSFLPLVQRSDIDLRIFFEIKSNLTYSQLAELADAHVVHVQAGVESLNSRTLSLMRKGVTGIQNVRLLRNCETLGITVAWNYLYGFPGETPPDYTTVLDQLEAISHLQPPPMATRVDLERFSPLFNDPTLGLRSLGPSRFFATVHDLPEKAIADLVYLFESEPAGLTDEPERALNIGIRQWNEMRPHSSLQLLQDGIDTVMLEARRPGREPRLHRLSAGLQTQAYLLLLAGRGRTALLKALRGQGLRVEQAELDETLAHWVREGLVFKEDETFVSLAVGAPDIALDHLDRARRVESREVTHEAADRRDPVLLPYPGRPAVLSGLTTD